MFSVNTSVVQRLPEKYRTSLFRIRIFFTVAPVQKRWLKLVLLMFVLYAVVSVACGIFLAEVTLHLPRRPLRHQAKAAEIVRQLRGEADSRQVANPRVGLAQSVGGGGSCAIAVLGA